MSIKNRLSITDVAETLGVTARTIMRWEKAGKIKKSKRDWRGWRFYIKEDLDEIKKFYESAYEFDENGKPLMDMAKEMAVIVFALAASFWAVGTITGGLACAESNNFSGTQSKGITETDETVDVNLADVPAIPADPMSMPATEAVKYTLGPDDVIAIDVRRHPEFSGQYTINSEGKIQYKYIGDIIISGLTKNQVKDRITQILSDYILTPEVDVEIVQYLSKVFYVVGEVGRPGKFYMRGDTISVREALVQASLPTYSAAASGSRLITPSAKGENNYIKVDVDKLLYKGDLTQNFIMNPGDVLYVPATGLAKLLRVIQPVTSTVQSTAGAAGTAAALGGL